MGSSRSVITVAAAFLLGCGCRPPVPERKYRAVSGLATEIHPDPGLVAMLWINQKKGTREEVRGRVTQETEILINGISARLEDVRAGDRGVVIVYPSGDPEVRWIVTRIEIQREESYMLSKPLPPPQDAGPENGPPAGPAPQGPR